MSFLTKTKPVNLEKAGIEKLYINGKQVSEVTIEQTTPFRYSLDETQDIGIYGGTPVDNHYSPHSNSKETI